MTAMDPFDIDIWESSPYAMMEMPFSLRSDAMEAFEQLSGFSRSEGWEAAYDLPAFVDGCPCIFCEPVSPSPYVDDSAMLDMLAAEFLEDDFGQVLQILDEEILDQEMPLPVADEGMDFEEATQALDDIPWPMSGFDTDHTMESEVQEFDSLEDIGLIVDADAVPSLPIIDAIDLGIVEETRSLENIEAELWNVLTACSEPLFPTSPNDTEQHQRAQSVAEPSTSFWADEAESSLPVADCEQTKALTARLMPPPPVPRRRNTPSLPRLRAVTSTYIDSSQPKPVESVQSLLAEHAEFIAKGLSKPRMTVHVNYDFPPGPQNHPDARMYVQTEISTRKGRYGMNALLKEGKSEGGPWFPEFKAFRSRARANGLLADAGEVDTEMARAWGGRVRPCVIEDVIVRPEAE